ncbi:hypothetical protein N24_2813 [Corynebacterium suranareeae]|uniref:Uncharacterized protein n=1 Tax=Corynebacterium suranareeae TaxID=2506452 RepID=A0A160PTI7_9CORY|nr:hypothetical protein [Corynebacterium suranareeae]BAU97075.1 hypothetical protein N24_2813 [Corynebacterium suranareeae]
MNVIRLDSNQTYDIPREGFSARLEFDLSASVGFRVEVPSTETNRRGNTWWIRNPQRHTEVTVFPDGGPGEFPSGTKLYVSVVIQEAGRQETTLQLPTYPIGGLRSIPILNVFPGQDMIRLQAGDVSSDSSLDSEAAAVRSALGRTIDKDGSADIARANVTVLVDKTSSMKASTSREVFDLMCSFATGVLSVVSQGRAIHVMTSSATDLRVRVANPEEIAQLSEKYAPVREVGWNCDLHQISPEDALVVISDDIPAEVLKLPNNLHVLSSRKPLVDHGTSFTYFDSLLINAVKNHDQRLLAGPAHQMFNALTSAVQREDLQA